MIEVEALNKTYGSKQVLSDVSFTAENGLVTGFVGPNGAGKSTTMRMIANIENPDSGITLVDGQPFSKAKQPLQVMGVYLGSDYLPNNMTGKSYLEYVCHIGGVAKERVGQLLEIVEISHAADKKISSYSLGMRQRVGLAAAIAGDANTLMLDEPVNGLDPMGVQWLRRLVKEQASKGKAVLLSSHLLSELELVADKVVMLDAGWVVKQGALAELSATTNRRRQVLMKTSNDVKIAAYLKKKGIDVRSTQDGLVVFGVKPEKLARLAVKGNLDLYMIEEKQASLEEMFMSTAAGSPPSPPAYPQEQAMFSDPRQPEQPRYFSGGQNERF